MPRGDLTFLNIYAFNDSPNHYQQWDYLNEMLPRKCNWLIGDDFNMVEDPIDKSSSCMKDFFLERFAQDTFKYAFGFNGPKCSLGSLKYSWDNLRKGVDCYLVWLDSIYLALSNVTKPTHQVCKYMIPNDVVRFDHHFLSFKLEVCNPFSMKFYQKMNMWKR